MKSLVLAEKPSVARDIARVLGCHKNISGAIEGSNYIVTWALGHLVTLADPEEYDKKFKAWDMSYLPMVPKKWELVVIKQTSKQYHNVKTQLFRKDVSEIIIATDAGREGELVARWILDKSGCHKPIRRLWISSVTDKAIKEGFAHLKDGRAYNDLYHAARSRAEADWLVGINASQALMLSAGRGGYSLGRVQTPTLAMICRRLEIGGYELRFDTGSVFYTENFFSILGIPLSAELPMNIEKFREILKEYTEKNLYKTKSGSTKLYCIRIPEKGVRYVRMEVKNENWVQIGLVEDVTVSMRERLRIEHERDYDTLTGLYNRRAFKRESESIFGRRKKIRHAAFIMLDLDNLKYTNDTFGHDWGDEYIRQAGMCLEEGTPKGTLCAHISGDEFNILFYGYESQNAIRKEISKLKREISSRIIRLPDGQEFHLSISGGIAWYPEDSNSLGVMRKHADFAMYQVKQTDKGRIAEFDQKAYEEKYRDSQIRKEFHRFVKEELVTYYFQPIISAKTGKIEAYEALMRANLPILKRPDVVMKIAREEGALREIERMTMFRATEAFADLREKKRIKGDALLFINSIASQHMAAKDEIEFNNRYAELQKQIVIEITEEESIDYHALETKRNAPGFEGAFALDDYGSGYSNEKSLLDLAPKYIKVDLSIIRDIDTDPDKQQIVENIVAYAHKRDMKIVAEGLETPEEIQKVLELEVDLLQGFYLARPEPVPGNINEDALKIIAAFYK